MKDATNLRMGIVSNIKRFFLTTEDVEGQIFIFNEKSTDHLQISSNI